jgi:hypothetical protein
MASNIVADTIDDTYPVAGEDNNSQGFRDNFNIIKTNFTAAKSEIETLQDDTAKTNADNVFFENTLERFVKKQETSAHINGLSGISANADLNFTGAHYFTVKAQDDITLTLTGWPTNNEYGEMFIQVYGDGASSRTITFAGTYSSGIASSMRVDASTEFAGGAAITTNTVTTRSHVVKAFTYDNGVTVFLQYVGTFTTTS